MSFIVWLTGVLFPVPPDNAAYCPECGGTGFDAYWTTCPACHGIGYVEANRK